jgi:hypothetical protein
MHPCREIMMRGMYGRVIPASRYSAPVHCQMLLYGNYLVVEEDLRITIPAM